VRFYDDARQVIELEIEQTTTSCGFGVPVMNFVRQRRTSDRGRRYNYGSAPGVTLAT
jgi:hypothetical protein